MRMHEFDSTVEWFPLAENDTQAAMPNPDMFIVHTAVDAKGPTDLHKWFARADVQVESHFWISKTGRIVQMMDTNVVAHANYRINGRAISVETEDDGDPEGNPWTPEQIASLVRVLRWVTRDDVHGIRRQLCAGPYSPGIGWHSMQSYPDPIGLTGRAEPSPWTTALGKTCPGRRRIRQFLDVVLPQIGMDTNGITRLPGGNTVPTDAPDPRLERVQLELIERGHPLPDFGSDGRWGDETYTALMAMFTSYDAAKSERDHALEIGDKAIQQRDQAIERADDLATSLAQAGTRYNAVAAELATARAYEAVGKAAADLAAELQTITRQTGD